MIVALWALCGAGWIAVLAGLRRGVHGPPRGPSLFAHTVTPAAVVLLCAHLGHGSLYATIWLAAQWWALMIVTGLRPERLTATGGLRRLGAWLAISAVLAFGAARAVF
ncbi:hypothetical protein [Actinomadura algeriensis]|uniref:Uncharacterized protein n=1 Tax=Actinomadura algeriensis TaxID=1679523 RepID=A0ABR9JIF3_9ACTN|nr:hypothetical protein [Actinomadura algeriensis]MBE1530334.1 hypothetical protein [Actinomadura algeriensis]